MDGSDGLTVANMAAPRPAFTRAAAPPPGQRSAPAANSDLETLNRQLVTANNQLEQLLAGGVKLMTDVLALARPEVFQKAAKVQRWARHITKRMLIERAWELDLAALLYPLGLITLPDELAAKYGANVPLTPAEGKRFEESSLVASRLIGNIPHMGGVARAVFYAHRGFDGSGWPKDGPVGVDLPQASRVLKVLVDLADETTGAERTRAAAFEKLAANARRYDPSIFRVARTALLVPETQATETEVEVTPNLARNGDVLVNDLMSDDGRLMLSAGTELTEMSIRRLQSLALNRKVSRTIKVRRLGVSGPKPTTMVDGVELF